MAAAAEAFREHGSGASVPQIARRARAGKATVYRGYGEIVLAALQP